MSRSLGAVAPLLVVSFLIIAAGPSSGDDGGGVTYDARSLIINGKRELLFSGSIHYTRSTPDMWPELIDKARRGGLNTIETYVFWNVHEPEQGKYNFEGNYDLVKFMKLIQEKGMYAMLRIGPFIQAEWNYGGFPFWLRDIANITFRTNNPPFKNEMKRFTKLIVDKMQEEKLYASQGGPIILSQIENEYSMIEPAFKEAGAKYISWAAKMATEMATGVPWIMCKQKNSPEEVISTCNGRNCGDTFTGYGSPTKPILWTENWTAQYRVFGDPPSQRSAEDLAYSVARFFSKNGTLVNYYMYHGGTNFGRTASAFVTTRYYDEAPLDEFGMEKEPKYGHLRDLHHALKLAQKALLWGSSYTQDLATGVQAIVYKKPDDGLCAAFLTNNNSNADMTVSFRGGSFFVPRHSISILPDCKTVVYNTQTVNAQHNARTFHPSKLEAVDGKAGPEAWQMYQVAVPTFKRAPIKQKGFLEHITLTRDATDYLWYSTTFYLEDGDLPMRQDIRPVIQIYSQGHALHAFVNGQYVGSGHGNKIDKSFVFQAPIPLRTGANRISLLAMTVGLPDNGPYLEKRMAGVRNANILGLNTGSLDLSSNSWGHQIGLTGETERIYDPQSTDKVQWGAVPQAVTPITWYKRYFDAPHGTDPVVLEMGSMGKGMVWVNGVNIGRYWINYVSPLGKPTQVEYHVPRSLLKDKGNMLVVLEETGGDPSGIVVSTTNRDNICTFVSDFHTADVQLWQRKGGDGALHASGDLKPQARLTCPPGKLINDVAFASFGNPQGLCGNFTAGSCHSHDAKTLAEKVCLAKRSCVLPIDYESYNADPNCAGTTGTLAVQAKCSRRKSSQN